jgi:hypothetical protein
MPEPVDIPLHLCQILEEEFENLHATLEDSLVDHAVVRKDWAFHAGHVKDPAALAAELEAAAAAGDAAACGSGPLAAHLAARPGLLAALRAPAGEPDPGGEDPPYAAALNQLLGDDEVFEWSRFEQVELRDETRALRELDASGAGQSFDADNGRFAASDRARYRRLLLEDAFPGFIRRVYDLRLNRVLRRVHSLPDGQSALCFSGGGIRSGTFALGVLQGLARHGLLDKFDYLSTVSGGGYIGGWLTAWIHRHPEGLEGVIKELNGEKRDSRLQPEPAPLRHLRDYSSFLTPRTGLLSADTWTFVTIYVRNLLLNWSAMIPLLLSVLMAPRVFNAIMLANPSKFRGEDAPTLWLPTAFLFVGALLSGYVVAFTRLNRPSNGGAVRPGSFWDRNRGQRSFLKLCFLPLLTSALLLTIYWAWLQRDIDPTLGRLPKPTDALAFPLFGLAVGLIGGVIYMLAVAFSWRHDAKKVGEASQQRWRFVWNAVKEIALTALAAAGAALLLYLVATKVPAFFELDKDALVTTFEGTRVKTFTQWYAEWYTCLALPAYLLVFFAATTLFVGFTSRRREVSPKERRSGSWKESVLYVEDEDREWLARFSAWLFIGIVGWALLSALVIFGPLLLLQLGQWAAAAGGLSGLLTVLGGGSAKTPANAKQEAKQGWRGVVAKNLIFIASVVFIAFFITLLSFVTSLLVWWLPTKLPLFNSLGGRAEFLRPLLQFPAEKFVPLTGGFGEWGEMIYRAVHYPTVEFTLALALGLQLLGQVMARNINLNKFSLHASYRDRLIRAFLGASRLRDERRANPFTGFDPRDNLYMHELRPGLLTESDFKTPEQADSGAPAALAAFVDGLKRAGDKGDATPDEYLRRRISEIGGASKKYFEEGTADAREPSFKSALFADLNRILQTDDLDRSRAFAGKAPANALRARAALDMERRSDYRVSLNRFVLEAAYPDALVRSAYPPPPYKLLHVVCMALNLVGGDKLAWQHRKAETFTASPLHAGSFFVGYRRARDYGGRTGISLGTAMAISGAAASSNMGYFSPSPVVTFVLTLFNARLGWWLGNPGAAGAETFFRSHPRKALSPIIEEAFGLTNDENPYVLLSDGGHFENLGLYEMVLRRCRNIIVVDGSADPQGGLEGLGDAVRKIRIDLGIRIEFDAPFPIVPRPQSEEPKLPEGTGGYCAVGLVHYEDVDEELTPKDEGNWFPPKHDEGRHRLTGRLIYIKPTIYGDEPRDIYNYAHGDDNFPHESTADQFFDEPQFESHRMLGSYVMEQLREEIGHLYDEAKKESPHDDIDDPFVTKKAVDFFRWVDISAAGRRGKVKVRE